MRRVSRSATCRKSNGSTGISRSRSPTSYFPGWRHAKDSSDGTDERIAPELGNFCGKPVSNRSPDGSSAGGELQRVLLCRALISDPQLLILDEPTTFVDNRFEKELYELLAELNERMAIVMVSHDLGTVSRYVKSMACINRCFHYHPSNTITAEQLQEYDCPIQLISHGPIPHTVLSSHAGCACCEGKRLNTK